MAGNRFKDREKSLSENTERVGQKESTLKTVNEEQNSENNTKPTDDKKAVSAPTSIKKPKEENNKRNPEQEEGLILQGFYITEQQKKALGRLKYEENINLSKAAREALDLYLKKKGMI